MASLLATGLGGLLAGCDESDDTGSGGPAATRADGGTSDGPAGDGPTGGGDVGQAGSGDGPGGDGGASAPSKGMAAAYGGSFASPDGRLLLEIPRGALNQSVQIEIKPVTPPPAGALGTVYGITPAGLRFLKPAKVTIRFTTGDLAGGMADDTRLGLWVSPAWRELPASRPNVAGMTTSSAQLTELGTVGLLPGLCRACPDACVMANCKFGGDGVPGRCMTQGNGCSVCVPGCDGDGDGFCPGNPGQDQPGGDCNDNDSTIYPEALEVCGNSVDDDCDFHPDDGCKPCKGDADCGGVGREACIDGVCSVCEMGCTSAGCMFGNETEGMVAGRCHTIGVGCNVCVPACDSDGDGYCPGSPGKGQLGGDCDDMKAAVNPKAAEVCGNGIDDDCNGFPDDQCAGCDDDSDCAMGQFCQAGTCMGCSAACSESPCTFMVDEGAQAGMPLTGKCASYGKGCARCVPTCDGDGDGYCTGVAVPGRGEDCKDTDPFVYPRASEICGNDKDDNCNNQVDEGCTSCKADSDCKQGGTACLDGVCDLCMGGCDPDTCKFGVEPMMPMSGVAGRCHTYGNSCQRCVPACDKDGDGYCPGATVMGQEGGDCDDMNGAASPRAQEVCGNMIDDDCDGRIDEGCATCAASTSCSANERCTTGK